jgi:hypothetical protein
VRQGFPVALHEARIHPVHAKYDQFRALTSTMRKTACGQSNG